MTHPLNKLGLGSSQFAFEAAARGRPPKVEVRDILEIAARARLAVLNVDGRPGQTEIDLGEVLPRPNPFRLCVPTARPDRGADFVEGEVRATLRRLGVERCETLMVPSAGELMGPYGLQLWDRLKSLKDQGVAAKIGVSVFASDDPLGLARRFHPDVMQVPASLLDQRLLVDGTLNELAARGVEVHLRPIFLNGLLFLPPDRVPSQFKEAAVRLSRARRMIAEGRSDPLQASLGFALSRPEASAVLVGVSSTAEISAVIAAASSPPPDLDWDEMALDDPVALDPHRWAAA